MKKILKINSLIILLILTFNVLFPILSIATEETVSITFKDANLYNAILTALGSKVESSDGTTYTITITQSNLETITELDITNKKIISISGLEKFTHLNKLKLEDKLISDITPLSSLTKLTYLNLGSNEISDITPLSSLTELTELYLKNNKINVIDSLRSLTKLTHLDLGFNQISDITPLSSLTNLTHLNLENNKISDVSKLSLLTNLTYLVLENNQISKIDSLSSLRNLTCINLGENEISDISPLSALENLEELWLHSNKITGVNPIGALKKLKKLALYSNTITSFDAIKELTTLEQLNFSEMQISDISFLEKLTNIKTLFLSNNNIEDISMLSKLKELTFLSLDNNPTLKDVSTLKSCTKLEKLYLHNCNIENINSAIASSKTTYLKNLKELGVSGNSISDLSKADKLASLEFSNTMYLYREDETKTVSSNYQTIKKIIKKSDIKTAQALPAIFTTAMKTTTSKLYTDQQPELINCTLSTDKTKITLNENATEATITIKGGAIADSQFIVRVNDGEAPVLDVEYSTTEPTNKNVRVVVKSNKEIEELEGWTLSQDKLTLTKEYTENGEEEITVSDMFGNSAKANIKVSNIDINAPKIEVLYNRTEITSETVKVTIKSNEALQELEGWILSEDKLSLAKEYTQNVEEQITVYDLAGNKAYANIKVNNIDIDAPEVVVQYSTTVLTNKNVTVTIVANKELQPLEGWTLSADKLTLTKEYSQNEEEVVTIYDLAGHERKIPIKIANIDKTAPEVGVQYSTTETTNKSVTATITSNKELQPLEGWTLSTDKLTLKKEYVQNVEEVVSVYDLAGNVVKISISIKNIETTGLLTSIQYSTTEITNKSVTATIVANKELQPLTGWTLSTDKLKLTKEYTQNVEEVVTIYDLAGHEKKIPIKIANIDKTSPEVGTQYSTTEVTNNSVTVTITSNKELQSLAGWTLSIDKLTLTKEYNQNVDEVVTVYDLAGNAVRVPISIKNIDTSELQANIRYSTTEVTNKSVTVTITSNKKLQALEGWTLSTDKLTLTKEYTQNVEEEVTVYDLVGNKIKVNVSVNNIDTTAPEITVKYSTTKQTTENVTVQIIANEKIQQLNGWTLSEDKLSLTKTYAQNQEEEVTIYDLAGNERKVSIRVNNIEKDDKKDDTVAKDPIPQTGQNIIIAISLISIALIGIIIFIKLKGLKQVK